MCNWTEYLGIIIMAGKKILGSTSEIIELLSANIVVPAVNAVIVELLELSKKFNALSFSKEKQNYRD